MVVTLITHQQITYRLSSTKKYITLLCFLGLLWSQGASVSGIVISDDDKMPIHGASIYAEELGIGTTSLVNGRFVLDDLPKGDITLTISMIGFKDVNKTLELKKESMDIGLVLMSIDPIKGDEIIVDAHHRLQPKDFASNVKVYGKDYQESLKASLALTLEEETGLAIRSMGQGTTQPVIRGYSGNRFLLTESGITTGDLSNTSIDHTVSMDMASFNKIEIIRGPEALLYGSNTIGGVINVSRQSNPDARFNKVSSWGLIGTESANTSLFGNFSFYIPFKSNHQLRLSLLGRKADDQISPIGSLENTALSNQEVTGSYSYFGTDYISTISFEQIAMNYGIPGSPEGHIDGVDIDLNKSTQKFNLHKGISFLGFQTLDIDQRFIDYGHTETEKGHSYASVILDQQIFSLQGVLMGPRLNVGSLFQYRNFQAGGFYWTPDTRELNIAVFGLHERELGEFTLQLSTRAEYLSVVPDKASLYTSNLDKSLIVKRNFPILSAGMGVFRNWNNWELSIGTMLTGRAPGIEDLYSDGPHLGTYAYEIGQPTLELERTLGVEASLEYQTDKSEIKLTGYHNFSPNYHLSTKMGDGYIPGADWIEWGSGSSGWLYKYQMQGVESVIYGFESELNYNLTEAISFFGSASIIRGENLTDKTPLAYMPPDKFLFSTELDINPVSASLTLKKVLPQTRLGEFETKTDGYFLADLNGTYTINTSKVIHKIIVRVDNIFDQEYYNHLSRIKMIMPEKGRSIGVQYRVVF